jgi:hypothetical protein
LNDVVAAPGSVAAVTVSIDDQLVNLQGLSFRVNFDPTLQLATSDIVSGPVVNGKGTQKGVNQATGVASVVYYVNDPSDPNDRINGPGTVATFNFHVPANAPHGHRYALTFSNVEANNGGNTGFVPTLVNGSITTTNEIPVASDQSVSTVEDTPLNIHLSATDADGDPLTYSFTNAANGTLTGTAPDLIYTPNAGYSGPDSFTFKANDGAADSNTATVSITVTPKPDIDAPVVTNPSVNPSSLPAPGGNFTLSVNATDNKGVTLVQATVALTGGASSTFDLTMQSGTATAGVWGGTFTAPANATNAVQDYQVTFTARDLAGNSASTTPAPFTVRPVILVAAQSNATQLHATESANITASVTNAASSIPAGGSSALDFTIVSGSGALTNATDNSVTYVAPNTVPAQTGVTIRATSRQSATEGSPQFQDVNLTLYPPVTVVINSPADNSNVAQGTSVTIDATAQNAIHPQEDALTYTLMSGPGTLNGNVYTAPATVTGNEPPVIIAVTAPVNGDTRNLTLHLTPITITLTPDTPRVTVGQSQNFSATIAGANQEFEFLVDGVVNGNATVGTISNVAINGNTATFTYTAPTALPNGNNTVALMVRQATQNAIQDTVNVTLLDISVNLTEAANKASVRFDGTADFDATVKNADNVDQSLPVTFSITQGSDAATIDPSTGVLTTKAVAANTTVTVQAATSGAIVRSATKDIVVRPMITVTGTATPDSIHTVDTSQIAATAAAAAIGSGELSGVDFTIQSGGGTLSNATDNEATYTPANVASATPVVIRATSRQSVVEDPANPKFVDIPLTVHPPVTVAILSPANDANVTQGTSVTIQAVAQDAVNAQEAGVTYALVSGPGTLNGNVYTAPSSVSSTPVVISATATASGDTKQITLHVVAQQITDRPPVLTVPAAQVVDEGQLVTFQVSATDPENDPITFSAANLPTGATFDPATRTFSFTPSFTQGGDNKFYIVTFIATDNKGLLDSDTVAIQVKDKNAPPTLSAPEIQTGGEGTLLSFNVSATDPENGTVTLAAAGLPSGATFDAATGTFSFTPSFTQAGSYTVTFTATDSTGNTATKTTTININNINQLPTLTVPAVQNGAEGSALSFTVSANDPDTGPVTLTATNLPAGATFDPETGVFSFTPSFTQEGMFTVTFTATDSEGGMTNKDVMLMIENTNQLPVLTVPSDQSGAEGSPLSFTVSATDPDGEAVTLSASGLPTGATFDATTGTFSFTPSLGQAGAYTVTFTATDSKGGASSKTVALTIGQPPTQGVLQVGTGFAIPGNFVNIPIVSTENLPNPSGLRFTVSFNGLTPASATGLELRDVLLGDGLSGGQIVKDIQQGTATVNITGGTSVLTGNPLAILRFRVPAGMAIGTTAALDLSNVAVTLEGENGTQQFVIPQQTLGGTLHVVMPGDVNGDGKVNVQDATRFLRMAINLIPATPELIAAGDVAPKNADGTVGDGKVNVQDVTRIVRRAVGLEPDPWP